MLVQQGQQRPFWRPQAVFHKCNNSTSTRGGLPCFIAVPCCCTPLLLLILPSWLLLLACADMYHVVMLCLLLHYGWLLIVECWLLRVASSAVREKMMVTTCVPHRIGTRDWKWPRITKTWHTIWVACENLGKIHVEWRLKLDLNGCCGFIPAGKIGTWAILTLECCYYVISWLPVVGIRRNKTD